MANPRPRIYLASRSPRRRELLKQIGVQYDLLLLRESRERGVDVDESVAADESAPDYVRRIAITKAETAWGVAAMRRLPLQPVLAADTTVALDGIILGKPDDTDHARELLGRLSGRVHQVLTAVAIARNGPTEIAVSTSDVEFRELTGSEIDRYVASGEPIDKAGAYAIQGRGALFVRTISGSYSGIMGLPLFETGEMLRRLQVIS
jgi:septum formation protein